MRAMTQLNSGLNFILYFRTDCPYGISNIFSFSYSVTVSEVIRICTDLRTFMNSSNRIFGQVFKSLWLFNVKFISPGIIFFAHSIKVSV